MTVAQTPGTPTPETPTAGDPTTSGDRLSREHVVVIAVLLVATFVVILNETVMSVAVPVLQRDLDVPPSVGQWLTTAFMLTMAVVIPLTGFLIERHGTRRLFLVAMSAFTAGTVVAFAAPGFEVLLVARVIQAVGTAIMLPLLMTTVMTVVPEHRRGVMMGNISVVIAVAPALGPTLSGLVLNNLGWRWIFGVVGPVAVATLVVGAFFVRPVGVRSSSPIDLMSVPLAVLGFGGLVYGLAGIGEAADHSVAVPLWIPFAVGAVALAAFVARQLLLAREGRALLDLRVFGSGTFSLSILAMVVAMATMMGTFIVVPYFAQTVLGFSPFTTGLVTLPGGLLMGLAAPVVGRIYDLRGARPLVIPGAVAITAGVWSLSVVDASTTVWWLIASNMMLCLGLAATFTPLMTLALGSVAPERYSHGSAALGTFQQVAGAVGTALFVTVMTVVSRGDHATQDAATDAIAHGVRTVFTVAGVLGVVLIAIVCLVRPRSVVAEEDSASAASAT